MRVLVCARGLVRVCLRAFAVRLHLRVETQRLCLLFGAAGVHLRAREFESA